MMNITLLKRIQREKQYTDMEMAQALGLKSREYFNRVKKRRNPMNPQFIDRVRLAFPEFF